MPRFFAHGELHVALLALLRGRPMHGYELITALRRLFGPRYRPSAGSVYPALGALVAESLLSRRREGPRVLYELTSTGRDALERRGDVLAALEVRTGVYFEDAERLDGALARFVARVEAAAPFVGSDAVGSILEATASRIEALVNESAEPQREDPR